MAVRSFEEEEFQAQFNGRTLLRILAQTRSHWRWVLGFVAAVGLVSFLDSYFTYLGKRIIDEGILAESVPTLTAILRLYGLLILVQAVAVFCFIFLAGVLGERVQYDLRRKMFGHLQDLSLSYYDRTPVGWMLSRVTSDSERIANLVTWGLLDVTWGVMNIGTAVLFMILINWRLALIVLAILPLLLIVAGQFKVHILSEFRLARRLNSEITRAFDESISGVRVVKALRREDRNLVEFTGLAERMYASSYRAAWMSALFLPVVQVVSALAVGAIVWYGGFQARIGALTIGGIQAFISYITFILWPVQDLARVYAETQHAVASAERVFSLIDARMEVKDRPGAVELRSLHTELTFDAVDFFYSPEDPVLSDFNLTIKPAESVALVGPTGSGKSTIVNLLCRFYEPSAGQILIGGRDYLDFTLASIQSKIGMVLQTPHLFSGTIEENIRYGRLEATAEEVITAARMAGAHDFVLGLELGYETQVGEGGSSLSVGQKQLISLARAILAQPELFIMDEATSSVDTVTEARIQQGMGALMRNRTAIIIAHRLSTIRRVDRILFIEAGRIVESGSHSQLLHARGPYFNLYTHQFRQEYARDHGALAASASD